MTVTCESDVLIIGGGPAGLSAAINASSEGLAVRILDAGSPMGGQARESSAIENYPGFPDGVTGSDLMSTFVRQARKFGTGMVCPLNAARLDRDEEAKRFVITTDDYQEYVGKSILLALGLSYRRLLADGLGPLMGRGVFYGRPAGVLSPLKHCNVAVVGGANSAGQAVVKLASNPKVKVHMFIRKTIGDQMSTYLIERIKTLPNVELCEGCEVTAVHGEKKLEAITYRNKEGVLIPKIKMDQMYIFIGATPRTFWLKSQVELDKNNFIYTWKDVSRAEALPYETSLPGVFAAGDVRANSTKRIASAIGEGAGTVPMIHRFLAL